MYIPKSRKQELTSLGFDDNEIDNIYIISSSILEVIIYKGIMPDRITRQALWVIMSDLDEKLKSIKI